MAVLRQKIALAEIDAKLAKESEVRLALKWLDSERWRRCFPGRKASLSRAAPGWETRLRVRKEETAKAEAKVRLLIRDMNDLLGKLTHLGYKPPVGQNELPMPPSGSGVEP